VHVLEHGDVVGDRKTGQLGEPGGRRQQAVAARAGTDATGTNATGTDVDSGCPVRRWRARLGGHLSCLQRSMPGRSGPGEDVTRRSATTLCSPNDSRIVWSGVPPLLS